MDMLSNLLVKFLPWVIFFFIIYFIPLKLMHWARRQAKAAYLFGALMQIMLPDPYAERTVKVVQEVKQQQKQHKKQREGDQVDDSQQP